MVLRDVAEQRHTVTARHFDIGDHHRKLVLANELERLLRRSGRGPLERAAGVRDLGACRQALLLVLEDVHWAEEPALAA